MTTLPTSKGTGVFFGIMAAIGGIMGIWAFATLMTGLSSVNWQVSEMARQFLVATGNLGEYETLVDYYTHIKGVEYLIAVAFFAVFPAFYKSLNPKVEEATASTK
ncbi:MAG: hypothetical protein KQH63_16040 [Desulfobulbaceae bacterium]|nr:hypothetical protein [Desulfobulbaceae bacterium]